jgi:preprotein translocase subunit SecA
MVEEDHSIQPEQIKEKVFGLCMTRYQEKEELAGREVLSQFEKSVILQTMDNHWREHLASMDYLRQGIHLRGYAQKDPKQEYKREAFTLFKAMLDHLKYDVIRLVTAVQIQTEADATAVEEQRRAEQVHKMQFLHQDEEEQDNASSDTTFRRTERKIGRNDPCPCGSGKKYKSCHGALA